MRAARETCTWIIERPVEKRLRTAQAIGIHLLSEKALFGRFRCARGEHRNALSQRVSTALRGLGLKWLKITFMFKLTRPNT